MPILDNFTSAARAEQTVLLANSIFQALQRQEEISGGKIGKNHFNTAITEKVRYLGPGELAELYVSAAVLANAFEMAPTSAFSSLLGTDSPAELRVYATMTRTMATTISERAKEMASSDMATGMGQSRKFIAGAVLAMARVIGACKDDGWLANAVYRAFDAMDNILGISYERETEMSSSPAERERLFEGAGMGVQSSYATVLQALDAIVLPKGSSFIDLGSGYGRVGLIVGLLRPDVRFTGYEYVAHRVEVAQSSAARAGVGEQVRFVEQDLSDTRFAIPEADTYYLFDPFSEDTYRHVFRQLNRIGSHRAITVVTKGRAGEWFQREVGGSAWAIEQTLDGGSLSIFRSMPLAKAV